MLETDAWEQLRHFRQELYNDLGLRQDSLFDLVDAATQHLGTAQLVDCIPPSVAEQL